jgi:transposase
MAGEFWLSDEQWTRLEPLLPNKPRGVPRVNDRRVISGIVHVLQSGCRWKDAPALYGPPKTLYNRNVRWAAKGVWRDVFEALAAAGGPPAEVLIDSTHVKAHRSAAGGKGGRTSRQSASAGAVATPRSTPSPTARAARSPSC